MTIGAMASMPNALFHTSPAQRVALARQRYFEEGIRPSGIVSDAVLESWSRCVRTHHDPHARVEFDTVSPSRSHLALQRNRPLLAAWEAERTRLEATLAATSCAAMLADATGVIVAATCARRPHEHIIPIATRVGVNLCEEAVGTPARCSEKPCVESIFGVGLAHLMSLPTEGALPLGLANGLTLMARAQAPQGDGLRILVAVPAPHAAAVQESPERVAPPSAQGTGTEAQDAEARAHGITARFEP